MELKEYDLYNIAIRSVRLYVANVSRRFQQRYFVGRKSAIDIIKVGRYINTIYKDSNQERTGFHDRNRKGFLLFIDIAIKHYNQRGKMI